MDMVWSHVFSRVAQRTFLTMLIGKKERNKLSLLINDRYRQFMVTKRLTTSILVDYYHCSIPQAIFVFL